MRPMLNRIYRRLARRVDGLAAFGGFCAFTAGLWQAWPPLALIISGGLVFGCLAFKHVRQQGR